MTLETPAPAPLEVDRVLLGFTRALRAAGVAVTSDRSQSYLDAVALLGADDPDQVRRAGRATLCRGPDDLIRHEQVFEAYFLAPEGLPRRTASPPSAPRTLSLPTEERDGGEAGADPDEPALRVAASETEVLRHRDIADLAANDRARVNALLSALHPRPPVRRALRRTPWRRGDVDTDRTLRQTLRHLGEPDRIAWRRRGIRTRRVVLLIDVSGSMSPYADVLLRLAHRIVRAAPASTEVFTVGTRLTHLTRALRLADAERAMTAAGNAVPDWSGGTRLGETLKVFLDRWGQRGLARGSVVVVFSDGWERGDASLLGEQARRLARLAHRVVWVNPHRGKAGYQPLQAGVVAVLPHLDDFLAGHSLATYADLCEVIARA